MTLTDLIARIESGDNLSAWRFEPARFDHLQKLLGPGTDRCMRVNRCDLATARVIMASSWGRFQLLGSHLYGPSFNSELTIMEWLQSESAQTTDFWRYCQLCAIDPDLSLQSIIDNQTERERVARLYNGPGAVVEYSNLLLKTAQNMTFGKIG